MLSVWDSLADFDRFQRDIERNFAATPRVAAADGAAAPAMDVREEAEGLVLEVDLPGVKREDLQLSVDGDLLTLKAEAKPAAPQEGVRYHRVERRHGALLRRFRVPPFVDGAAIAASLADGVLTLRLPKRSERKPRTIEIKD